MKAFKDISKTNIFLIGGSTLALAATAYLLWKKRKIEASYSIENSGNTSTSIIKNISTKPNCPSNYNPFPLKKGSGTVDKLCSRNKVKALQINLNYTINSFEIPLKVDGIFGDKTEKRLLEKTGSKIVLNESKLNEIQPIVPFY